MSRSAMGGFFIWCIMDEENEVKVIKPTKGQIDFTRVLEEC